ncbi:uncharacterized protein F5891DRAFT_671461 [Suillus fuscotomentosus]|uniref:Uncharacterized protein n=1 Tax=Suillus fuscotomentosus TaxID=1912939 RepID=A0AAD4DWF6_9AGAM|nr:uncharacterized protein F5891DRAFT_671461 [Suillus fuscotomentosus]KAG1895374.1 hypothetical protein F5891DRAFT_671461 [Suillus fuscotomentosus]
MDPQQEWAIFNFPSWFDQLENHHAVEIQSRLLSVISSSSPLENIVQLGSAAVIIFENSFYVFDKRHHLQGEEESVPSFYVALEQYMASPHAAAVREGVSAAVQAYEEAMTTAAHAYEEAVKTFVYPYQGNLPAGQASAALPTPAKVSHYTAWMAKLPFKPFKRKAKEAIEHSQQSIEHSRQSFERSQQSFARSKEEEKESSCSQAKAELMKAVLEITLNHRLRMSHRPSCCGSHPADLLVFSETLMSGDATQRSSSEWS